MLRCWLCDVRSRGGAVVVPTQSGGDSYVRQVRRLWPRQWKVTYAAVHQERSIHQEDRNPIHWYRCWSGNHRPRYSVCITLISCSICDTWTYGYIQTESLRRCLTVLFPWQTRWTSSNNGCSVIKILSLCTCRNWGNMLLISLLPVSGFNVNEHGMWVLIVSYTFVL